MRRLHRLTFRISMLAAAGALLAWGLAPAKSEGKAQAARPPAIAFDVAEDGTRFAFDETPVHEDGLPAYGGAFVTQGYLYPAGTLTSSGGVFSGVNPDGSPQFPEKVAGTWTCYGVHIGDGAHTTTGPWVISTQMFDFGNAPGELSISTNGIELADTNVPFRRGIIGTTGLPGFRGGEQAQVFLGFNESAGVTLRVHFVRAP
jgi:hypothetical protein